MQAELLRVGDVVIHEIDIRNLTDDEIVELHEFGVLMSAESRPEDPPTPIEVTRASFASIPDFLRMRAYVARASDGAIVGLANANFWDAEENRHLLNAAISVRADRRRAGIGTALLRFVTDVADAEERTLILGSTSERVPAGAAFAAAVGAEAAQANHVNRLVLEEVDRDLVKRWIADGPKRAPGYSLEWIDGIYPDDKLDEILDVMHVMNDAPRDNVQREDMRITADQYHDMAKQIQAIDVQMWALFVRHDESSRLVGLTDVSWLPAEPDTVSQGNTGVRPEHRGHGLGKWLKAVMLQRILDERPQAKDIRTGNADSNDAMLAINRQLGFKPYIAATSWQVTSDRVRTYLESR